jgi:putative ATP-dependent endonuclease of OLD family
MKIESVRIENFRSFKDETIYFNDYTCFVGPNGSGKSTVINALNVFFRQSKDTCTDCNYLTIEDFHHKNSNDPIKITVTFINLPEQAKTDLSDYVRQDKLIITLIAVYNQSLNYSEIKQYGNRLGFEDFRKYFEADKNGSKVSDLKNIYSELKNIYADLPNPGTKPEMENALREYESSHPEKCVLIPSEDQFYGVSKGINKIAPHIQWVFISASKDITEECEESKNTALGQLLARTVRSKVNFSEKIEQLKRKLQEDYNSLLSQEQSVLNDISSSLKTRLESWSHPGISAQVLWRQDAEKAIKVEEPSAFIRLGERGFDGELARFGHGLQRSYMLALLQELATLPDETAPTLIMAIEEPEIYQHPPQARFLSETLHELSGKNSQIIVCSHHPLFIPGDNFESVRVVREKDSPSISYIKQLKYSDLSTLLEKAEQKQLKEVGVLAKLYPTLNPVISEMFFCNILIITEGIEDISYITTYLILTDLLTEFRRFGCHIIPVNGKSGIIKPLAMANLLNIPTYVVFDADTNKTRDSEINQHKQENRAIQELLAFGEIDDWPNQTICSNNFTLWKFNLTESIKEELGEKWENYKIQSYSHYGNPGDLIKNPLAIARALEMAWDDGVKSNLLITLVDSIIAFARSKSCF